MQQTLQLDHRAQAGQLLEYLVQVFADAGVSGHQADIGVAAAVGLVVVAGGKVDIAAQYIVLAPHDQQHLGVCLVADHAVDHLHAGFLQARGETDVGLLVEARPQLDHHGDVLAVARGFHQQVDQRGVVAGAVQRLLDGQHGRVVRGLAQQIHHRGEDSVGVMQQHVALAHHFKLVAAGIEGRRQLRNEARELQLRAIQPVIDQCRRG